MKRVAHLTVYRELLFGEKKQRNLREEHFGACKRTPIEKSFGSVIRIARLRHVTTV